MADKRRDEVINGLVARGWTREQAIGIASNISHESAFNPAAVGDGGKAYGLAQWHPDRQAEFQKLKGYPIQGSSVEDQLDFMDHELRRGNERKAGAALASATTAAVAASLFTELYERPADIPGQSAKRAAQAAAWAGEAWDGIAPKAKTYNPQQGGVEAVQARFPWGVVPTARLAGKTAVAASVVAPEAVAENQRLAAQESLAGNPAVAVDEQRVRQTAEETRLQQDAQVGLSDAFGEARRDPRVMGMHTIMNAITNDDKPDPSFDYMARIAEIEKPCGPNDECRQYMRENVNSDESLRRAHAEMAYRADLDRTYGAAGAWASFAGMAGASLTDPVGFAASVASMKAFQLVKLGQAATAARAGARGVAAAAAEGAVGNVAFEGIQDYLGEVKGTGDYVMAATTGAAFTVPFAKGHFRNAVNEHTSAQINEVQSKAVAEQAATAEEILRENPNLTPEQVARAVEEREASRIVADMDAAREPGVNRAKAVPDDISREVKDDLEGALKETEETRALEAEQARAQAEAVPDNPPPVKNMAKDVPTIYEQWQRDTPGGDINREIPTADGGSVKLTYTPNQALEMGKSHSVGEVLDALKGRGNAALDYLAKVMGSAKEARVRFSGASDQRPGYRAKTESVHMTSYGGAGDVSARQTLDENVANLTPYGKAIMAHELIHVATVNKLYAWENARKAGSFSHFTASERAAFEGLQDLFERFKTEVSRLPDSPADRNRGARYAASDLSEFVAQAYNDRQTQRFLSMMPGKKVAGIASNALKEFVKLVKQALGMADESALDEAYKRIDSIITMDTSHWTFNDGSPVKFAPAAPGQQNLPPQVRQQMMKRWADRMYQHAEQFMQQNPIDTAKLAVATARAGIESSGLILASSKNKIAQLVAAVVTETTTGAAGRKVSVAVRAPALQKLYVGNFRPDYEANYTTYRKKNGGSVWEDFRHGDVRRRFQREVFTEIHARRNPNYVPQADASVRAAADAAEAVFERARVSQIDAQTMGSAWLPGTARGYVPQALDAAKIATASRQDILLLQDELSNQFQAVGWDKGFADWFAPHYVERIRQRAQGSKGIDDMAAGGDSAAIIRDVLEDVGLGNSPQYLQALAAMDRRGGLSQTKRRLNIDMTAQLRPGLQVMDFYVTDVDLLTRKYARRTSGTVALTEVGIHGWRGAQQLREAMILQSQDIATPREVAAFDQVIAEVLGTPVAGAVISPFATNLRLLVGLQKLGGLVFTQAAEAMNMTHHVGLRGTLAGVASLPRMLGEVSRLKKGQRIQGLLSSIEQIGGEIGMENYKMVAPLDAPEGRLGEYMDNPGLIGRALRGGGHLQGQLSGFRALMAAQHRAVAEQIVMRAMRFIRDGGSEVAMRDMGFTPDVVAAIKPELQKIARWDKTDALEHLDLSLLSDPSAAEAFVAAVHRGTSQIIQGTFAGERSAWMHNDYLQLLAQLRTFGLTAVEKQWGRTRMNHGYAAASGILLAQVALAMPLHAARVALLSQGRSDQDQYLKEQLQPVALARAAMNYSSITGVMSDVLEITFGIAGGLTENPEAFGGRSGAQAGVGRLVPAAGSVDQFMKTAYGQGSLHSAIRQLPFGNLWYLVPLINTTKD